MTTEETPRKLWRRKRVAQARTLTALVLDRAPKRSGRLVSIQWSAAAISLFASVQRLAAGTDKDSGQRLPYASLRSVIEARVPGAIVVRSDLSQPWNGGGQRTFLLARGSSDDGSDVMEQVCGAISQWCTDVLFSWAERTGIADLQVERIRELAFQRRIVEKTDVRSASFPTTGVDALKNYPETRDVLKALLLEALDGEELFEGRGPVHRVISSSTLSNEIEFETWPIEIKGGSFSLVCVLSIETLPWKPQPIVKIRASKRIWMDRFPKPWQLFGQDRVSLRLLTRGQRALSINYDLRIKNGTPASEEIEDPAFLAIVLENGIDLGSGLIDAVALSKPSDNHFISVPYRPAYGAAKGPRGVTAQDQLDLFKRVADLTKQHGLSRLPFVDVKKSKRDSDEYHAALTAEMLVHHAAAEMRLNTLSDERVTEIFAEFVGESPGGKFPEESLTKAGTLLLKVREANGERIRRVFEDGRSTIVFVSRTADEAKLFRASTTTLFPNVDVIDYRLPAETHGLFQAAPTVKKYAKKFEVRAEAWRPLAQVIAATHPRARVIVQVERDYENEAGKQVGEDIVNKEAGRYALAHFAGANVQYLIPKKAGDAYGYLIRLQAAIYDLMFGHSGMAPVPAAAVAEAFPEEKDRPTAIVGFSVINLARRRRGGGAGAVAVATMVDVETGITKARVAWSGGASDWMEFGSALVYVAGLGDSKIGADREAAKETFQKFVSSTIAALVKSQVRPLVMFDATSASGLWPWLNNASLSGLPTFGREQISWKDVWEGLTLVRVRTQSSARLLTVMSHENLSVEPPAESNPDSYASMTNSTVKVVSGEGKGAYVTTHSWNRTRKVVRGTSVYRELPGFRRSKREKGAKQTFYEKIVHAHPSDDSVIPESIEVTVASVPSGVDPDAVAALISSLREGYAHSAMATSLPAPLSFKSKVADYMSRHRVEAEDPETVDPLLVDESEIVEVLAVLEADEEPTVDTTPAFGPTFGQLRKALLSGTSLVQNQPLAGEILQMPHSMSQSPRPTDVGNGLPLVSKSDDGFSIGTIKDFDELRRPILNLPDFATSSWFKKYLSVSRSHLRVFHSKWGRYVQPVTGFAWPPERPDVEEFYGLLPAIAKYPYALRFILGGLFEKMRPWEKRLYNGYYAARREAGLPVEIAPEPERRHEQVVELAAAGKYEIARAIAILHWAHYQKKTPAMSRLAVHDPEMSEYIGKFLACDHTLLRELWTAYAENGTPENADNGTGIDETWDDDAIGLSGDEDVLIDQDENSISEVESQTCNDTGSGQDPAVHEDAKIALTAANPASLALRSSTDAWAADLSKVIDIAMRGRPLAPDAQICAELRKMVDRLQDCFDAFEAARPKSMPTELLVVRLLAALAVVRDALTNIDGFDETNSGNVASIEACAASTPHTVSIQVFTQAEAIALSAEAAAEEADLAQRRLSDADIALSHKEYLVVGPRLFSQVVLAAGKALAQIESAFRMFRILDDENAACFGAESPVGIIEKCSAPKVAVGTAIAEPDPEPAVIDAVEESGDEEEFEPGADNLVIQPLPTSEKTATVVAQEIDPLLSQIERKADELFICQEFGLAYHFARAGAKVLGDPVLMPYGTDELRLIALGERMAGLSRHEPEGFRDSLNACATLAQAFADGSGERHNARRIALLASVIPTALLQVSDSGNAFAIINSINVTGSCSPFFFIIETLNENRKLGFPLSPTTLRTAGVANAGLSYAGDLLENVRRQIASVQSAKLRFVLGQKVKHWLVSSEGPIGILQAGIDGPNSAHAAAQFASRYASRDIIQEMLQKAPDVAAHGQAVDGSARERLIALVSDIAATCANYSATAQDADEMRGNSGRIEMVRRLTVSLVAGIKKFETDTSSPSGSLLVDAANSYARKVLGQILDLIDGMPTREADRSASSFALHVPLLWLPGMTWSSAWTPSPNEASRLLEAIMTLPVPRIVGDPGDALGVVIDERRTEDAFIPAKMLLGFAPRFGWEKARISDEMARLESAESIRKGQLKSKYQQVSGLVTKVRRMALGGLEGSAQLEESLRAVKIDGEPMSVTIDFLPEEIEGTRIADVNAAANRLSIIEVRARKLLDEAKLTFSDDIAKLAEEAKISPDERTELERLLAADDLATLSDWIPMFGAEEQSRPGLAGRVVNEELKRFFEISASTPNIELVSAKNAVVAGEHFGSFDFSCLNMERREEIRSILQQWFDFKRSMKVNSAYLAQIGPRLADLLSNVAYETEVIELNKAYSQERRSIFAIDAKMSLPFDTTSLMLPDFGSSTNDGWRIIAAPGTITNAEILSRAEGAEPRGVLVLVFGSLTLERRYQLKIECIKRRRKVLVIDELLLLTMLSAADPRPLTMFEIAQAFTTATPYQDYGRSHVPREMFKGRARERASIVNPHGSYIVYGGRRLGKTALLRHISRNRPEHGLFAYLDLVDSSSSALWERASGALKEAFAHPVGNSEEFDAGVKAYLDGDGRRRILLLLDEADNFIKEQANKELKHHHVFLLLSLMAETNHRFKFVLAGLHNVSRITRSENSPLAQISNDPVRIGPLVERDVGDAEILVRGPMSALGYEFANREDVWRILSYANYYPVLIQVFCQGLLRIIEEQTVRNSKVIKIIDGKMIDSAMADNQIRKALYESFDKTITHIEQRYELLTYIIAERALIDAGEGVDADGLTASEVADKAGRYWPEAFPKGSDPSEVEYLLDEMEGFGILRWTASGRWALRSRMLLDLMVTDEEELLGRIYSFKGKQPETQFDPKNSRRSIAGGKRAGAEGKISPLTDGQEAEIMHSQLEVGGAVVLFGSSISNIEHVHIALETSHTALGRNQRKIQLEIRGWRDRADLITQIRAAKKNDIVKVMVVTNQTEWSPDWVAEAARQANVAKGIVRPVFIGDAKHALAWSNAYPLGMKTPPRVRIKSLRPWARSYVASRLDAINALKSPVIDSILESTGGWNDLCQTIFSTGASGNQLENAAKDLVQSLKRRGASERFGVPPYLSKAFNALSVWCPDGSSTADIAEVLRDISSDLDINVLLRFGSLVGILSLKVDLADSKRELMDMNVLARDILSSSAEQ